MSGFVRRGCGSQIICFIESNLNDFNRIEGDAILSELCATSRISSQLFSLYSQSSIRSI